MADRKRFERLTAHRRVTAPRADKPVTHAVEAQYLCRASKCLTLAGAPSGAEHEYISHRTEVAIVGDQSGTALFKRDGELERIRQLQCVTQSQASSKHCDISVDVTNLPTRILGDCPPISLGQRLSVRL